MFYPLLGPFGATIGKTTPMTPKMAVKMMNGSIAMLLDSADIPTERDFHDKTLNHKTRMGATTTRSRDENAAQPRAKYVLLRRSALSLGYTRHIEP